MVIHLFLHDTGKTTTAVVLCYYYENTFMCSCMVCTCANTFVMSCCVYAGSFMEFECFEVKPEDDSKEITECSYDYKPSTGMFSVS